jgi:hypothetical protein
VRTLRDLLESSDDNDRYFAEWFLGLSPIADPGSAVQSAERAWRHIVEQMMTTSDAHDNDSLAEAAAMRFARLRSALRDGLSRRGWTPAPDGGLYPPSV